MSKMNLCTAILATPGEAERPLRNIRTDYYCVTNGGPVRNCEFFAPMRDVNGEKCWGECRWFSGGCRCRRAQKAARERTKKLLERWH
jgi:hypothetical protein